MSCVMVNASSPSVGEGMPSAMPHAHLGPGTIVASSELPPVVPPMVPPNVPPAPVAPPPPLPPTPPTLPSEVPLVVALDIPPLEELAESVVIDAPPLEDCAELVVLAAVEPVVVTVVGPSPVPVDAVVELESVESDELEAGASEPFPQLAKSSTPAKGERVFIGARCKPNLMNRTALWVFITISLNGASTGIVFGGPLSSHAPLRVQASKQAPQRQLRRRLPLAGSDNF